MATDQKETAGDRDLGDEAYAYAGEAGRYWFTRGVAEGYSRVLASARTMTREMMIDWLQREVSINDQQP